MANDKRLKTKEYFLIKNIYKQHQHLCISNFIP